VAALEDAAILADDEVLALLQAQPGLLFDDVERPLGSALVDREHGTIAQEVHGVVAPFAIGDLAAVEIEDGVELEPVETDEQWRACRAARRGGREIQKLPRTTLQWLLGHKALSVTRPS
jgi:hypothetical protein